MSDTDGRSDLQENVAADARPCTPIPRLGPGEDGPPNVRRPALLDAGGPRRGGADSHRAAGAAVRLVSLSPSHGGAGMNSGRPQDALAARGSAAFAHRLGALRPTPWRQA